MIGNYVKNLQHLLKSVEDNKTRKIIIIYNGQAECGEMLNLGGSILIFNNIYGDDFSKRSYTTEEQIKIDEKLHIYRGVAEMNKWECQRFFKDCVNALILLPIDFESLFDEFTKNNAKQYKQLQSKYGLDISQSIVQYLFVLCNNNFPLFAWGIKNIMYNNVQMPMLSYCLKWNNIYNNFSSKLKKGTINAYNGFEDIWCLINEINRITRLKRANDSIMQFNTAQKHLLKSIFDENDDRIVLLLNKFAKLSDSKQRNFIRKMSTIENAEDIIREMNVLCDIHFEWNKASFMNYLENNENVKCEIVYDNENVVVVKSFDYETIKRLGKHTNWCISKNKRYWNDYIERKSNREQYVIFDFSENEDSEYSIVGFTVEGKKYISHAHSFTNNNLINDYSIDNPQLISFVKQSQPCNIQSVLRLKGIPNSIFMKALHYPFKWNKDDFFKYLNNKVKKSSYVILANENGKVALMFENMESYTLISSINENIGGKIGYSPFEDYNTVIFFDFNKKDNDATNFMFSFIQENNGEEMGTLCYDANGNKTQNSFDSMLKEFNIPFNIIKRSNTVYNQFISAITSFDFGLLKKILTESSASYFQKNKKHSNKVYNTIRNSLFVYHSLVLLNIIYDCNYKLSDFLYDEELESIVSCLFGDIANRYRFYNNAPSEEDFALLDANMLNNPQKAMFLGFNKALSLIIEKEQSDAMAQRMLMDITQYSYFKGLSEYVISQLIPFFDPNSVSSSTFNQIVRMLSKYKMYDCLAYIYPKCKNNSLKSLISNKIPKESFTFAT